MRAAAKLLALLIVIGGVGLYFTAIKPVDQMITKGLDIAGGVRLVLEGVETPEVPKINREMMERSLEIVRYRVDTLGVSEPNIQLEGDRRIIVELAGITDTDDAARLIGQTAMLKFVAPGPSGEVAGGDVVVTGQDLDHAAVVPLGNDSFGVSLQLKGEGIQKFADATTTYLHQQIAIVLDDQIVSAPSVNEPILTGQAQITGGWHGQDGGRDAKQLANVLNGGALPVKLQIIENRSVSATLGQDSFNRSLTAGMIGVAMTVAFLVVWYRGAGFLAVMALAIYMILTLGALVAFGAVLTLPGIAGIILSISMAIDANVLIFERVKEELHLAKSMRGAVHTGFNRAFSAILDSNLTTIMAAAILFYLGTGPVKGFGLTLMVGVIISMFTAITVTRWLLNIALATGWFNRRTLLGIPEEVRS